MRRLETWLTRLAQPRLPGGLLRRAIPGSHRTCYEVRLGRRNRDVQADCRRKGSRSKRGCVTTGSPQTSGYLASFRLVPTAAVAALDTGAVWIRNFCRTKWLTSGLYMTCKECRVLTDPRKQR
jgi:hypothetical protein